MRYHVAIKLKDYSAEFSFNTERERQEFISVTQALHPTVEVLVSQEWAQTVAAA